METKQLKALAALLEAPKHLVIVGHKNPDGDAVGSTLALALFLEKLGHTAQVIMPNDFPKFLKWMPNCESILTFDSHKDVCTKLLNKADLIFTLDFNSLSRIGTMTPLMEQLDVPMVMIDHHQEPDDYARFTYSDPTMGSTAQMVYHFIEFLNKTSLIDAAIATNLYVGIMTDTGSFRFPATSSQTHQVVAQLIEKGANNSRIHQQVYDTNTPERLQLLGIALNNLVVLPEYRTAYITLTQQELDSCKFKKGDTEGFVNYALSIENIVLAAIFIESAKDGIIKISLRSKGAFSVNLMARNHFNGGGHINAAGGKSDHSMQDTIREFISILPSNKEALLHE